MGNVFGVRLRIFLPALAISILAIVALQSFFFLPDGLRDTIGFFAGGTIGVFVAYACVYWEEQARLEDEKQNKQNTF